ncbi:unnamed protein product [Albugo candida]|uniref:RING-type domain-containing protein n=1 Tax=Albugo candida TaxID=65357 RepID=A0A024GL79_9STRA|nr:unnamed protein product [Albugo candida]|eukprot:CCI47096.1 unnamed protein product [Albugo candida]
MYTVYHQSAEMQLDDVKKQSTERRLLKMSCEKLPSAFDYHGHARILCVGDTVVYRVSINVAVNTASTTQQDQEWIMWLFSISHERYHQFVKSVVDIFILPNVVEILHQSVDVDQEQAPYIAFIRSLYGIFHRYNMLNDIFAAQHDVTQMDHGRCYLESFLAKLWETLEIILPAITVATHLPFAGIEEVYTLYNIVCDFLMVPQDKIMETSCVYTNAILCLEDVEVLLPKYVKQHCSICLDGLLTIESSQNGTTPKKNSEAVKLPCGHIFHENCIIHWLGQRPTCPECRAPVGMWV